MYCYLIFLAILIMLSCKSSSCSENIFQKHRWVFNQYDIKFQFDKEKDSLYFYFNINQNETSVRSHYTFSNSCDTLNFSENVLTNLNFFGTQWVILSYDNLQVIVEDIQKSEQYTFQIVD